MENQITIKLDTFYLIKARQGEKEFQKQAKMSETAPTLLLGIPQGHKATITYVEDLCPIHKGSLIVGSVSVRR